MGAVSSGGLQVRAIEPSLELRDRAVTYFELKVESGQTMEVRTLPEGCTDLIFDVTGEKAWISGPQTRAHCFSHQGPSHLIGIQLVPGVAHLLTGEPLSKLLDRRLPLKWATRSLLEEPSQFHLDPSGIGPRLDAFLEEALGGRRVDRRVRRAVAVLVSNGGCSQVLERDAGTSRRTLTRLFLTWVGLSPKALGRMIRFQRVLQTLGAGAPPQWARVARDLGYADQAHLIRDFSEYSGLSPNRFSVA